LLPNVFSTAVFFFLSCRRLEEPAFAPFTTALPFFLQHQGPLDGVGRAVLDLPPLQTFSRQFAPCFGSRRLYEYQWAALIFIGLFFFSLRRLSFIPLGPLLERRGFPRLVAHPSFFSPRRPRSPLRFLPESPPPRWWAIDLSHPHSAFLGRLKILVTCLADILFPAMLSRMLFSHEG